jgi:hypothetical protein
MANDKTRIKHFMIGAGVQIGAKALTDIGSSNLSGWQDFTEYNISFVDWILDILFPVALGGIGFVTKKQSLKDMALGAGVAGIAEFLNVLGSHNYLVLNAKASARPLGDSSPGVIGAPDVAHTYASPAGRYAAPGTHSPSYAYGTKIAVAGSVAHPSGYSGMQGAGNYGSVASLPIDNPMGRTAPDVPFDVFLLVGGQGGKHH